MNAITLHQPWARLIAEGLKTIEPRTHDRFKCLVGQRIAIHAGKRRLDIAELCPLLEKIAGEYLNADQGIALARSLLALPLRYGAVIATAKVVDAAWLSGTLDDDEAALCETAGRFGLFLEEIREVHPPDCCRGAQGIWQWNPLAWRGLEQPELPLEIQRRQP